MFAQNKKLIEMEDLVQQERNSFGLHSKQMDSCYCTGNILYTRLSTHSARIHVADRRSTTRISKNNQILRLLG